MLMPGVLAVLVKTLVPFTRLMSITSGLMDSSDRCSKTSASRA